jgi:hypothetical protein
MIEVYIRPERAEKSFLFHPWAMQDNVIIVRRTPAAPISHGKEPVDGSPASSRNGPIFSKMMYVYVLGYGFISITAKLVLK